jgi:hypothetical protein
MYDKNATAVIALVMSVVSSVAGCAGETSGACNT